MCEIEHLSVFVPPLALLERLDGVLRNTIFFGGNGDFAALLLGGEEIPWEQIAAEPMLRSAVYEPTPWPFTGGYVGLLSYDAFCPFAKTVARNRVFEVHRLLVWNLRNRRMAIVGNRDRKVNAWLSAECLRDALTNATSYQSQFLPLPAFELDAQHEDSTYGELVAKAVRDIRDGSYYQINLLQYFHVRHATWQGLVRRLANWGGAFSSAWRIPGLNLVSFSPERFVRISPVAGDLSAETYPIKGTIARGLSEQEDAAAVVALETSSKERAELAMIIDLLRNDLNRVCRSDTVAVVSCGHIETLPYAHHRIGVVRGSIRPQLFGEFCQAMLPGGSITGAPKRAAMEFIRGYETRERGYFMGNAFYWDPARGMFDASILIRTAYAEEQRDYAFAAGSGIVLQSDPIKEADEVAIKCRVLTAAGPRL